MTPVRRRAVRGTVAGLVVLVPLLVTSCTKEEGTGLPPLAPLETTTTVPLNVSATTLEPGPSKAAGKAFAAISDDFDRATSARDVCGLLAAMNADLPDVDDRHSVVETYQKVAASVSRARSFVPSELSDAWTTVETATASAAKAAERSGGQIDDPALQASFSTGDFEQATTQLVAWSDEHCKGA
jgi:hypothetical protein